MKRAQENANKALGYLKENRLNEAPKWVKEIVELYLPSHLEDPSIKKDLIDLLHDIAEGDLEKYYDGSLNERMIRRFLKYLDQEYLDQEQNEQEQLDLLGTTDVAKMLGWPKSKVSEYYKHGYLGFPKPSARIGGRPVWTLRQIEKFASTLHNRD